MVHSNSDEAEEAEEALDLRRLKSGSASGSNPSSRESTPLPSPLHSPMQSPRHMDTVDDIGDAILKLQASGRGCKRSLLHVCFWEKLQWPCVHACTHQSLRIL